MGAEEEKVLSKKTWFLLSFFVGLLLFIPGVRAEAACDDPGCALLMSWHICVPVGTPSPPCWYDAANDTYLLTIRDEDMGDCTQLSGDPGWWFWRAQWSGACGTCCTGGSGDPSGPPCGVCIPSGCGVEKSVLGPETQYFAEAEDSQEQVFLASDSNSKLLIQDPNQETFFIERLMASIFFWIDKIWDALESFFIEILNIAH